MTTWAWVAIVVASNLANIVWRLTLHRDPPLWALYVRIGLLGIFWLAGMRLPELKALRGYLIALVAALVGMLVKDIIYQMPAVTSWIDRQPWRDEVVVSSVLKLLPVAAMALTAMDLSRRDLFLIRGDLTAPGRVPFTTAVLSWVWLGLGLVLVVGALVAGFMFIAVHPDLRQAQRWLALLPVVVTFAAINAFSEEFTFRSVLLARIYPCVGTEQALWMTSVRFGLGHWFGNPSGPFGAIGATLLGLMLGKSMVETKGLFWAWIVHFSLDVLIFSLLILGRPRG